MEKIKVARIVSGLWQGGVESKLTALLLRMDRSRFDVSVICLRGEGYYAQELRDNGIPVHVSLVKRRLSPPGLLRLAKYLSAQSYHIVHTHMYRANTSGTIAAKLAKTPVVISHLHSINTWDHKRQLWMDRFLSRYKDMTLFVSEAVRKNFVVRVPLPDVKQMVIHNGVDTDFFTPGEDNPMHLSGGIRVGAVGRLMPAKGYSDFIEMLARPEMKSSGIVVYILGDGPLRASLLEAAESAGVTSQFRILGFSDDVLSFLRSIHIFAMPSRREGFSNALLEAMSAGLPSVVTDVGGNPEAVQHGVNGYLAPPRDPTAFSNLLLQLAQDDSLRNRMAIAARKRAVQFSLDEMVRKTEELYVSLAGRAGADSPHTH